MSGSTVGLVVIGRNEGDRLRVCLDALAKTGHVLCYVDSGSTDDSIAVAAKRATIVDELDASRPFTAARGRNRGFALLIDAHPDLDYVHVFDGDTEISDGWLETAIAHLDEHPDVGAVCGRRRERFPEASRYNQLCDMEWDTPIGEAGAFGGDALIRASAWTAVGGYDETLIAGEDPEFSHRIRQAGWGIQRLDADMTIHDANITTFRQWFTRARRAGHAYAEGASMHGEHGHYTREVRSIGFWAGAVPAAAAISGIAALKQPVAAVGVGVLAGYPVLWSRVRGHRVASGDSTDKASLYASSVVVGKFAEMSGMMLWAKNRITKTDSTLVEYKQAESPASELDRAA